MTLTISAAFFAAVLAFAGFVTWQAISVNIGLIRDKFAKHRALERAHIVTVTILSGPGFVPAPPPSLGAAVRVQPVFGPYIASGSASDRRLQRMTEAVPAWKPASKVTMKAGTHWHRPYLPRPIAIPSDYRFEPCLARNLPMAVGASN
ncbi:hypothetical protein C7451_1122 [Blastomonas natatoria]|uniref:Uncharacterized protein n=1 Tax=Blastomonas natatoria TaxID=34015 RepID=A0A2V3UUH9_9SPHN|nr:hypothetical protein [Blastomonas natatoria]PXW71560.1 hypothetical protein C7451_1122 [Blastomonas natatoria]